MSDCWIALGLLGLAASGLAYEIIREILEERRKKRQALLAGIPPGYSLCPACHEIFPEIVMKDGLCWKCHRLRAAAVHKRHPAMKR